MKSLRVFMLLLAVWQSEAVSVSCGAEPKSPDSETDANAIFAAMADRYRRTENLRIHGRLQVLSGAVGRATDDQFEILFSRGKEIYVKVGEFQATLPGMSDLGKGFRIKEGRAYEYMFGLETKQYKSEPEEFLRSNVLRYRLVPSTLPALLFRDKSMFFSDHLDPKGWEIDNTNDLPESEVMLKLRWAKGDTFVKICRSDQKLLECEFRFRLAGLKSASFEFEDESSWDRVLSKNLDEAK